MSKTVFYAWQNDADPAKNRYFIRDCIDGAIKKVRKELSVEDAPRLDHDTKDETGTPAIADTILAKIEKCTIFIADVTLVGRTETDSEKLVPNPNVLFELGYAAKAVGWQHIVLVMNTVSGAPNALPFDLRHRRHPRTYCLSAESETRTQDQQKSLLTEALYSAIAAIVQAHASEGSVSPITLQFADAETDEALGSSVSMSTVEIAPVDVSQLPDWSPSDSSILQSPFVNRNYIREIVDYIVFTKHLRCIRFVLHNAGEVPLPNVEVKLTVRADGDVEVLTDEDLPNEPSEMGRTLPRIRSLSSRFSDIEVTSSKLVPVVLLKFGDIQPGASKFTQDCLCFGVRTSQMVTFEAEVLSDAIPKPLQKILEIDLDVHSRELGMDDVQAFLGGSHPPESRCLTTEPVEAIRKLVRAAAFAEESGKQRLALAVSLAELRRSGADDSDFRRWIDAGYVECVEEITRPGVSGRAFKKSGSQLLPRSCLVLTDEGLAWAANLDEVGECIK